MFSPLFALIGTKFQFGVGVEDFILQALNRWHLVRGLVHQRREQIGRQLIETKFEGAIACHVLTEVSNHFYVNGSNSGHFFWVSLQ
jgi:hypothetical protein